MTNKTTFLLLALTFCVTFGFSQTIWDGPIMTFTKANNADWTQEANQDRITGNVWITRKNNEGLFNIAQEGTFSSTISPVDTEWGAGTTADLGSITFEPWRDAVQGSPPGYVGADMVVHLISDDIYIDIKLLSWTQGGTGGGFSYERSTPSTLNLNEYTKKDIKPFPNPTSDYLNFENNFENMKGQIFDLMGRSIQELIIHNNKIDVTNLNNGLYFLLIENHNPIKFIKA